MLCLLYANAYCTTRLPGCHGALQEASCLSMSLLQMQIAKAMFRGLSGSIISIRRQTSRYFRNGCTNVEFTELLIIVLISERDVSTSFAISKHDSAHRRPRQGCSASTARRLRLPAGRGILKTMSCNFMVSALVRNSTKSVTKKT